MIDEIRLRAYYKSEKAGHPWGHAEEFWLFAENEVQVEHTVEALAKPVLEEMGLKVKGKMGFWKEGYYCPVVHMYGGKPEDMPWHVVLKKVKDVILIEVAYEVSNSM